MVKLRWFSRLLLLFLCTAAFNPILISNGAHANVVSTVSTNTSASECSQPGLADFSTQQISPSASNASLPGHVVQPVKQGQARLIRPVNPTLQLYVELVFKIRNEAQFQKCLDSIDAPSSPEYRRYLNSTTLQPFLPTPGQKASVFNLLTRAGLIVTDGASPLVLEVEGNAKEIMSAFAIRLSVYSYGSSSFFATDTDPRMPSNLASLVNGILGLENYTRTKPAESPCNGPYCPQGIQMGYSISTLISSGETGSGQKVAVVDMPGDPNSQTAINTFDSQYGLTATTLNIVYPDGIPNSWDPTWASEAVMDIEAVHSVAPGATIVLAYPTGDILDGVDYVTSHGLASVISNSWDYSCVSSASCSDTQLPPSLVSSADSRLALDAAQGETILFASGDEGSQPDGSTTGTEFPASDPNVLAVGATNLALNGCGTTTCTGYGSETGAFISGGGYSGYFSEPSWQTSTIGSTSAQCTTDHLNPTCRAVPDVAMLGDNPGIWVYSTASDKCNSGGDSAGWFACSGTSLSTPLWAGFIGIALQVGGGGQFGNIAPSLYSLGASTSYSTLFHDVTVGFNGYSARTGWDPVTGWGSPIANNLASALSPMSQTPQTLVTQVDSAPGSGSVNPNCPGPEGCSKIVGFPVTVTATPGPCKTVGLTATFCKNSDWVFSNWSTQSGVACSANPCNFNMPNNPVTLGATFTQVTPTLTTNIAFGSGSISPNCLGGCSETVGSSVSVTATPSAGWQFSTWTVIGTSCSGSSSSNPCTFTMPSNSVTTSATFTQGKVTMFVSYSVQGGGNPSAPVFHYIVNGDAKSLTLSQTTVPFLSVDAGTTWSVTPNPLVGSSPSQGWYSNQPLTGTSSATTIVFVFYRQTLQKFSYSVSDGSGYSPPVIQSSQFGSIAQFTLTNTASSYWLDYGSAWTVTNPLVGSGLTERWFTTQATSGTIGASMTRAFPYQHQFYLTMQVNPSGAGSTTPSSGWYSAGQKLTIKATAKTGYKLQWVGSGTGSYSGTSSSTTITMNSAITETANFT